MTSDRREQRPEVYSWLDADALAGSYVPAMDALAAHKKSLREDLLDGFSDLREILLWQHALSAATLGQANSHWLSNDVLGNRWRHAALLSDDQRHGVSPHPPDADTARSERLRIVQDHLLPAFNDATNILRDRAGDYSDGGAIDDDDVDRQEFVAMRPRLHQRASDQHAVLRWALGVSEKQLTSHEDVLLWVSAVQDATAGYLRSDFADDATAVMGQWRSALISDDVSVWLLTQLADDVLPVMDTSLADAAERSNEKAKTPARVSKVPQG